LLEVTPAHEVVWEYVSPFFSKKMKLNHVYRAYRVPYSWVPQVSRPKETPIVPPDNSNFRI